MIFDKMFNFLKGKNKKYTPENKVSKKEYKRYKKEAREEVDKLFKEFIDPYINNMFEGKLNNIGESTPTNPNIAKFAENFDLTEKDEDDEGKIVILDELSKTSGKNNYFDKLQRDAKKWAFKNYSEMFKKEDAMDAMFGGAGGYMANDNLDIKTGDTGFVVNNIEFFEKLMKKDTHIYGAVWSIIDSVTSRQWEIIPAKNSSKANKVADFVEQTIRNLPDFTEVLQNLAYSVVTGVTFQEMIFDNVNGKILPVDIVYRKPYNFKFNSEGELFYSNGFGSSDTALPKNKFLIHSYKGDATRRYGQSIIGERVFWMYYFKRMIWRFRVRFLERFGNPLMVHKFQTEEERIKMNEALRYMASKGAIQVPEGSEILISEAIRDTQDFKNAIDDLNKEIEIAIVGQTATMTRESGGSYASDYIRQDQFYNKVSSLLQSIENVLNNGLIKPLVLLNYPREKDFPKINFNKTDDTLKIKEIERDLSLVRQQMPVNVAQLFRKIGLNVPDDMDEGLTTAAYYDSFGNVKGGLPPEIRHQVRRDINDPRLNDITGGGGDEEVPQFDGKNLDDPNDPDAKRAREREEERKRIAENREKRQGRPPEEKGNQGYANKNPKSSDFSKLFDIEFLKELKASIKDKKVKSKLDYRINKLKKIKEKE